MISLFKRFAALLPAALLWLDPGQATAQNLIDRPGAHTVYDVELGPHLAFSDHGFGGWGFGPGVRATWVVADRGLIDPINDSVGIGLGADLLFGDDDRCHGSGNSFHCHGDNELQLMIPVVMQWNFWFSRQWSAFAEPGLALRFRDHGNLLSPMLALGGRWQFHSSAALTVRVGYPSVTLGASFFL